MSYSRIKEHLDSQDKDIARKSSRAKVHANPIRPGMSSATRGTFGGPTQGNPPDASSPLPTDHEKQHGSKRFPIPACHPASKSDDVERGTYDPTRADKVMGEAATSADDFAPKLHTLPATTTEE
jgi:hypothetical protein